MAISFAEMKDEYASLWSQIQVRPERAAEIQHIFSKVTNPASKVHYQNVETAIGVPWYVVAMIHNLEASRRFDRHLHNGDPLTDRTVHVPKNRPTKGNPPFTWEGSAKDALEFDKLTNISPWTIERIAFELEKFNGHGYRNHHPHVKSPYLWSFSNIYTCGKYIADGQWSETAVSDQCGAMVLLHYMISQGEITVPSEGAAPQPEHLPAPPSAPQYPGYYLQNPIEDDPNAEAIQVRLKTLGINPGTIDADFGEHTEHAVRLFQARSADETGEPLEVDGIVGPKTWAALFAPGANPMPMPMPMPPPPTKSSLIDTLLDIAAEEVGEREQPAGSNRGPKVDQYIRSIGFDPTRDSYPWCMCFVYWCFVQAAQRSGTSNLVPKTGGVHDAWNKSHNNPSVTTISSASAQRNPAQIVPGMVFYINTGGSRGHTGIVVANVNGRLETIEGNTNDNGSREGIGVFRRTRRRIVDINLGFGGYG